MTKESVLSIQNLTKAIGDAVILDSINLEIKQGDFVGLMGLNGAGKTTLLNIIGTITRPTSGKIFINGYDLQLERSQAILHLGFMTQERSLDNFITVEDNLLLQAGICGLKRPMAIARIDKLLDIFDLKEKRHFLITALSGGMIQRVMLMRALINEPKVLVLDEPTTGVDVEVGARIWEYIRSINAKGTTIILTTHVINDLTKMCKTLVFLKKGRVTASGSINQFKKELYSESYVFTLDNDFKDEILQGIYPFMKLENNRVEITIDSNTDLYPIINLFHQNQIQIIRIENNEQQLESILRHYL